MLKKPFFLGFAVSIIIFIGLLIIYESYSDTKETKEIINSNYIKIQSGESSNPFGKINNQKAPENILSIFYKKDIFNILLIGIDTSAQRISNGEQSQNTDSLILLSVNKRINKVLLTSIPRDIWIDDNKINALYAIKGMDSLLASVESITGQKIDGTILINFDQFRWLIDSFGGVTVEIPTAFTDYEFPKKDETGIETIEFNKGSEIMSGDRALQFARSRKGNNGEGSDLMRAKRQQIILQGLIESISNNGSKFWPMDIVIFYNSVSKNVVTTLTLDDSIYLWDFYKDRKKYQIESFIVGDSYIYYPGVYPQSPYKAWVFVPRNGSWESLHNDINLKINTLN